MWEDNGHGVLLRVSWYTINTHIPLCRAQAVHVVPHNLSIGNGRCRENLKGSREKVPLENFDNRRLPSFHETITITAE